MIDIENIKPVKVEKLTLGEIGYIEDTTGVAMSRMGDADVKTAPFLTAVAVVAMRRNGQPEYTIEQARQEITLEVAEKMVIFDD